MTALNLNPGCCCDEVDPQGFLAVCMCSGAYPYVYPWTYESKFPTNVQNTTQSNANYTQVNVHLNEEPQVIAVPYIWGFYGTGSKHWPYGNRMVDNVLTSEGHGNRPFGMPSILRNAFSDRLAKIWTEFTYAPNANQDGVFTASHWLIPNMPDGTASAGEEYEGTREDYNANIYMLEKLSNQRSWMVGDNSLLDGTRNTDVSMGGGPPLRSCRLFEHPDGFCNPSQYPLLDLNVYYDTSTKRVTMLGSWAYDERVFDKHDLRFTVAYPSGTSFVSYNGPGEVDTSQWPVVFVRNIAGGGAGELIIQHDAGRTVGPGGLRSQQGGGGFSNIYELYRMEVGYEPPSHRFIAVKCDQCPSRVLLGTDSTTIPIGKNLATLQDGDQSVYEVDFNINGCSIGALLMSPKLAGYHTDFAGMPKGSPFSDSSGYIFQDYGPHLKSWNSWVHHPNTYVKEWSCGCGSQETASGTNATSLSGDWYTRATNDVNKDRWEKIDDASVSDVGWSGTASQVTRSAVSENWTDVDGNVVNDIDTASRQVRTMVYPAVTHLDERRGFHLSTDHVSSGDLNLWKQKYSAYVQGFKYSGTMSIKLKSWTGDEATEYGTNSNGQTLLKVSDFKNGNFGNDYGTFGCTFKDRSHAGGAENAIRVSGSFPGLSFGGFGETLFVSRRFSDQADNDNTLNIGEITAGSDVEVTFSFTVIYPPEWRNPPQIGGLNPNRGIYPYQEVYLEGNLLYAGNTPDAVNKKYFYPDNTEFMKWPPVRQMCMPAFFRHAAKGGRKLIEDVDYQDTEIATFKNSLNFELL